MYPYSPQLAGSIVGPAMQQEDWRLVVARDHLELPPTDRPGEVVSRQGLERRLLRGGTRRELAGRIRMGGRILPLPVGEHAEHRALPLAVEEPPHPRDLHQGDADSDDHRRNQRRPRATPRATATRRAPPRPPAAAAPHRRAR